MTHLSGVWFKVTSLEVASGHGCRSRRRRHRVPRLHAGIAVKSTGHATPVSWRHRRAGGTGHPPAGHGYTHDLLEPLAARLAELTPGAIDTFFFANSGAEITEAAVKLAKQATRRPNVDRVRGQFHGRTHLTMAMTTSKTGYRPATRRCPPASSSRRSPTRWRRIRTPRSQRRSLGFDHLLTSMTAPDETAAMIIEPVLGEGGYLPAPPAFLQGLVERCRQHGILFVADEVQSGFGRTGRMFAVEHHGIEPDVICMAKGIAVGLPVRPPSGRRRELDDRWPTGSHGGTYGGNPIGCAAALATIDVLTARGFMDNVERAGEQLQAGLRELQRADDGIAPRPRARPDGRRRVRTTRHGVAAVAALPRRGPLILMNAGTYGTVLRWMPPLVVDADEIDDGTRGVRRRAQGDGLRPADGTTDVTRVAAWSCNRCRADIERRIDDVLLAEWDVPLGWFDVLGGLQRARRLGAPERPRRRAAPRPLQPQSPPRPAGGGRVGAAHPTARPRRSAGRAGRAHPTGPDAVAGDERHVPPGGPGDVASALSDDDVSALRRILAQVAPRVASAGSGGAPGGSAGGGMRG